ncbi:MAG: glycerate kinase [Prevotella sp.]|jgi:glycerate kinase
MKYIVALDSFKGSLTSIVASETLAQSLQAMGKETVCLPVSDGGDGMIDALYHSMKGWKKVECRVHDALMRSCPAEYLLKGDQAILESAQACGLLKVKDEELRPLLATSYGVGEMLMHAIYKGARNIIIGLGGTATSDCGLGMLKGFKDAFLRTRGIFDPLFKTWQDVEPFLNSLNLKITLASDVSNPLTGPQGAANVFAPQKGATAEDVKLLERKAVSFATMSARHFGFDRSENPGAGAAGGLGYAFMQYFNADMQSGAELILSLIHFDDYLAAEPCVVYTGEGKADKQTLMGKLPFVVLQHCKKYGAKCILIAGKVEDKQLLLDAGFNDIICINDSSTSMEEAMKPENAKRNLSLSVKPRE